MSRCIYVMAFLLEKNGRPFMSRNLRIIHCLRAPIGGLFRHVVDLALEQSVVGHEVGVLFDRSFLPKINAAQLELLEKYCRLGVRTTAMARLLHPNDFFASRATLAFAKETQAQILHGHGAKGGAYARYAAKVLRYQGQSTLGFYTPHGGSLHYDPESLMGRLFLSLEKKLARMTSGLIFESQYSADLFVKNVGGGFCPVQVIPNGLRPQEFQPNEPAGNAADFVFVGELRTLKGVDVLIHAFQHLFARHPQLRLAIVGDGPDMARFQSLVKKLKLTEGVSFYGRLPTRKAFSAGRVMVVPSRAESFPYVVLEAAAAKMPLIASRVGGIPEIVAGSRTELVPAGDVVALAARMEDAIAQPALYQSMADELSDLIGHKFTTERMTAQITDFYLSVLKR